MFRYLNYFVKTHNCAPTPYPYSLYLSPHFFREQQHLWNLEVATTMSETQLIGVGALPARFLDPATPVQFDEQWGSWHVFSYDDVSRILIDDTCCSADYGPHLDVQQPFACMCT